MNSHTPLVTIIVPVFNGQRYLGQTLESILAQTYANLEILVMDNASTDRTPSIIDAYGPRLRRYRQSQNRGLYGNCNDGIAMANGIYIDIFHADDIYAPNIVEREVSLMQRFPDVGAVFCLDNFIDAWGRQVGRLTLPRELCGGRPLAYDTILNALLTHKNRFLRCPSCMVRAGVYQDLGTYKQREFGDAADLELWLRIAHKHHIVIAEEYLFSYRHGHDNASHRYQHLRTTPEDYFRIMDATLAGGDSAVASFRALTHYSAHRAHDWLMISVNRYIRDQHAASRDAVQRVSPVRLLASAQVQRGRLLILYTLMYFLVNLPRMQFVADLFYRHWYAARR